LPASIAGDLLIELNWLTHLAKLIGIRPGAKGQNVRTLRKLPVVKLRALAPVFLHMAEPTSASPPSKGMIFFRRLGSTVALWSFVLLALFAGRNLLGDTLFLIVMLTLAFLGLKEFYGLVRKAGLDCFPKWGLASGVVFIAAMFFNVQGDLPAKLHALKTNGLDFFMHPAMANDFETGLLILFVLGLFLIQLFAKTPGSGLIRIATTLLGLMYIPWLLNFIQKLHFFPAMIGGNGHEIPVHGNFYVLYFILVTKFSDLGAYVTGSLIGKHKMIPRVSPGKTWEGFGGAIVIATGVSVTFAHFLSHKLFGMTLVHAIILGVLLSVSAVVGDLIESIFKREAQVKDSGGFFPGIGGILDLLDSLLFNAPLMYLYVRLVLTT
jgi:phosphatidate cytidylyltransferase